MDNFIISHIENTSLVISNAELDISIYDVVDVIWLQVRDGRCVVDIQVPRAEIPRETYTSYKKLLTGGDWVKLRGKKFHQAMRSQVNVHGISPESVREFFWNYGKKYDAN